MLCYNLGPKGQILSIPLKETFRQFHQQNPTTFAFRVNLTDTSLDSLINYNGSDYNIFAVGYVGGKHFIARIKIENTVYEYDGTVKGGLLIVVTDDTVPFLFEGTAI